MICCALMCVLSCLAWIQAEFYNDVTCKPFWMKNAPASHFIHSGIEQWARQHQQQAPNTMSCKFVRTFCAIIFFARFLKPRHCLWLFTFMVTKSHNLWNNDQKLYQHYSIVMPLLCDACVFLVVNFLARVRALSATTLRFLGLLLTTMWYTMMMTTTKKANANSNAMARIYFWCGFFYGTALSLLIIFTTLRK